MFRFSAEFYYKKSYCGEDKRIEISPKKGLCEFIVIECFYEKGPSILPSGNVVCRPPDIHRQKLRSQNLHKRLSGKSAHLF